MHRGKSPHNKNSSVPGDTLKRRDQSGEESGPGRQITKEDMLVCGVGAVAVDTETVQYGHIQCSGKVAVRGSSHRAFSQFETDLRGRLPRLMKQLNDGFGPFQWTTINATRDAQPDATVKRLQVIHQIPDPPRVVTRVKPNIHFHF